MKFGIFLIIFVLFSNCGEKQTTSRTDELIFANFRDIRDPNPHLYQGEMWAQEMLFDTLVSVEDSGIAPSIAESWDISKDGKLYTFHIRKGILFSDGEILDAYAVEKNFDAIWDNKERHVWLGSMKLITKYQALDAGTFIIQLSEPYYPLLTELGVTRPFALASPKAMKNGTTKNGLLEYIGSGPYILVEHKKDEFSTFEINPNYWGNTPKIKKITMRVIPDNHTRIFALNKGEIDLIYGAELLDAETLKAYAKKEGFVASTSAPTSTRQLILNAANPILTDINVRYALSHTINKKAIADNIFYGIETAADFLYATNIPYANVGLKPYEYNTEMAKQLLEKSGWLLGANNIRVKNGQRLELNLLYDNNSVTGKTISEFIQAELLSIGIDTKLVGLERQTYFDALKQGNFDIAHNIAWGAPYDPQSSLSAMRGPVYGDYAAQLSLTNKKEIDQAITDVFVSTDETKRQELYTYIMTELHNSAIYIPLTYENNKSLYVDTLKNVLYKPSQYRIPFEDMYFQQ